MRQLTVQITLSLALVACLSLGQAAPAVIGTVVAGGNFQLDDARVSGNATLFDGATIQTQASAGELKLANGARMVLGAASRGRVYQDHLLLEKGEGSLETTGVNYLVRARNLRVQADGASARGRVALAGTSKVRVAALAGGLRVTNSEGILVARLLPGTAMEFEPQAAGAAAPARLSGCLQKKDGHFLLTDETTNVTVELQGAKLAAESGNRVEIVGTLDPAARPVAGASQLVKATEVRQVGKGCGSGKTAAAGSAGGASGAAIGMAVGTKVAIVAGVSAATLVGGLAAAEKLPGQGGDNKPSASR